MNKTTIEYLDFVLSKITDISNFIVWNILKSESTDFDFDNATTEEEKHLMLDESRRVADLGITYGYFIKISHAEFRLTDKGIKAKELGGHKEYQKFTKKTPLALYQKLQLGVTIISLITAITFGVLNYLLGIEKSELKDENNLLKTDLVRYKDSINLYKQKVLLETPVIGDETSQSKNFGDLKND